MPHGRLEQAKAPCPMGFCWGLCPGAGLLRRTMGWISSYVLGAWHPAGPLASCQQFVSPAMCWVLGILPGRWLRASNLPMLLPLWHRLGLGWQSPLPAPQEEVAKTQTEEE